MIFLILFTFESIMKTLLFLFLLIFNCQVFAQSDTIAEIYYDKIILYSDVGYYSCPFDVNVDQIGTLNYRNNIKPFVGIGVNYKWGSLRIGSLINYNLKGLENYSYTKIFKIGTEFFYKRFLFDLSYYKLSGYTLINDLISNSNTYTKYPNLSFQTSSVNTWFFINKNFSHYALKGIKQAVRKNNWTIYLKSTNAITLLKDNSPILPSSIINKLNSSSVNFNDLKAFEIGILSGVAIAFRIKQNFQIGGMFGYGGVLIDRTLHNSQHNRNLIGLSPRYDFHIYAGYNKKKFFIMNYLDLEQRKIEFTDFEINSRLISYRLVGGYRF